MMVLVPTGFDAEVARVTDRLRNPTPEDMAHEERFNKLRDLVENCRIALGKLTEEQSQLVGLYLLSAVYLGAGVDYESAPTFDAPKPVLRLVP